MNNPNFQQNPMGGVPRPQGTGNGMQQFVTHYRQQLQQNKVPQGWQQQISPEERGQLCQQFYTQYRLLKPEAAEMEVMRAAVNFETQNFVGSTSKEQYVNNVKSKLMMMTQARQQQVSRMGGNLGPMNNGMGAMNPAQMGMMGQPGPSGPRQGAQQQFNPAFPNAQLQRPMQVSPVPMSQGQSSMGVNNGNPANLNQGQNLQQANMNMAQQNRPPPNNAMLNEVARKLMESCKPEVRAKFAQDAALWPEQRKAAIMQSGMDPIFYRFRQHAEMLYRKGALTQPGGMNGNQMQAGAPNGMPNQTGANQRQPNQDFDMNAIANQQMEAMRVQDQGAMVVPASNNASGAQMNGFPGQNPQQPQQQNASMAQRQAEAAAFNNNMQRQQFQHQQQAHAQAQAHAQLEAQRRRQAAQAQNPNLLQGLNGGLNLPPSSQSPAPMSMLNRPMHPPGQPGPPTPQQQPQNHVPVMTPQPGQMNSDPQVNALLREAQQRANAVAAHQPLTEQMRMNMIPPDLPPEAKQQLMKIPEQQFRAVISQNLQQRRANGVTPFPGLQPNQGQPNPLFNQQFAAQPGIPNPMMGVNMGRPGLNIGQPMPGTGQQPQMGQRMPQVTQQQRLQAASVMLTRNPGILQATDNIPYPLDVMGPTVKPNIPPEIKTWGQLKSWANSNPALLPNITQQKLALLQVLHYQDLSSRKGIAQGQHPQNNMPGLAPSAQITPNAAGARTPQPQQNMVNLQVTPQELQMLRQKLPAHQHQVSDDQLRQWIIGQKVKARQQQMGQQQMGQQHMNQQQQVMLAQQAQLRAGQELQARQHQMMAQQQGPNRPPTAQSQNTQPTPQAKAVAKPQQPIQPTQPTQSNSVANKGMKRSNDETNDATADAPATSAAPQAPAMVPTRSSAGLNITPEQMLKLTPAQQAQMKAQLLKAQDASNAAGNKMHPQQQQTAALTNEDIKIRMNDPTRLQVLTRIVDEAERSIGPRQPVQLPPQLRVPLQHSLKENLDKMKKLDSALRVFHVTYSGPEGEKAIRSVAIARALVFQQINKQDGTLNDQVTLSTEEFKTHMRTMLSFYVKVTQHMAGSRNPAQQSQPQQASSALPAQLNAANLKIVEQQQRQQQQKAPSAPTTDRPPFALGDQSARGAPTYFEGAKTVTNLVLPDKKRAKLDPGSQSSTPGPRPSPRMGTGKGHSPELTRQQPPKHVPQRPTFQCKAPDCEYSVRGYDTQADLDAHVSQVHMKIENPLQFALESMAEYLDVDQKTGEPRVDPNTAKRPTKAPPAPSRATQPGKPEPTHNVPPNVVTPAGAQVAAATPMAFVPTQPGMKGSPVTNFLRTPQAMTKVATPGSGAHAKATPTSMPRPAPKEQVVAAPEPVKEEEQPIMPMSLLDYSYEDTFAALDANGPFTCADLNDEEKTWMLRSRPASPTATPDSSAKDTPSTRTSDISENDNLHINLDMDMPDAWAMGFNGNALPLDMQLSEDMQSLGVMLPPMDNDDMMLFPNYGDNMMNLEALEKTMDRMGGSFDASMLGHV